MESLVVRGDVHEIKLPRGRGGVHHSESNRTPERLPSANPPPRADVRLLRQSRRPAKGSARAFAFYGPVD
jgi:hypothetical protein